MNNKCFIRGKKRKVFVFTNCLGKIRPTLSYNIKGKGFPPKLDFF